MRKPSWNALPADERGYANLAGLFAEAGRPDRARALLARYDVEVGEEERTTASDRMGRHAAEGAIALAEGRPEDAVAAFLAAREAMPGCLLCLLFELGQAYDAAGQPDSALAVYHRYLDTRILLRAGQDNVNLPFLLRRMGEVYDRQGARERAVEYYARFLDLWERADPEMRPQMDVVRSRIATLADEPAAGAPGSS